MLGRFASWRHNQPYLDLAMGMGKSLTKDSDCPKCVHHRVKFDDIWGMCVSSVDHDTHGYVNIKRVIPITNNVCNLSCGL